MSGKDQKNNADKSGKEEMGPHAEPEAEFQGNNVPREQGKNDAKSITEDTEDPSEKNKSSDPATSLDARHDQLTVKQQLGTLSLGLILSLPAIASLLALYILFSQSLDWAYPVSDPNLLIGASLAAIFGSSAFALLRLIRAFKSDDIGHKYSSRYLSFWPIYLLKILVGAAMGLLLLIAVSLGAISIFEPVALSVTNHVTVALEIKLKFIPSLFIAALGGAFYEETSDLLRIVLNVIVEEQHKIKGDSRD